MAMDDQALLGARGSGNPILQEPAALTPEEQAAQVAANWAAALQSQLGPMSQPPQHTITAEEEARNTAASMQQALDQQNIGLQNQYMENPPTVDNVTRNTPNFIERGNESSVPRIFNDANAGKGGWFTLADYYNQPANNVYAGGAVDPDFSASSASQLSTDNWRLLPPQYRSPNYYMINGQIIDRTRYHTQLSPQSVLGYEAGSDMPGLFGMRGSGQPWGRTLGSGAWSSGYAGQLGPFGIDSTYTT